MKAKRKNGLFLHFIGIFFLFLGIIAIGTAINDGTPEVVFWVCYSSLILIGIGIIGRNNVLIISQLNILTVPLLIWTIDFIFFLLAGHSLFGTVDYFFENGSAFGKFISLQHIYTLPLSFYALYKIKMSKNKAWMVSILQLLAIFIVGRIFTSTGGNINCIYKSCIDFISYSGFYYPVIWFASAFLLVFLTNKVINRAFI